MKWPKMIMLLFLSQMVRIDRSSSETVKLHELINEKKIEIAINTPLTLECQLDAGAISRGCTPSNLSYIIGSNTKVKNARLENDSLLLTVNTSRPLGQTITCSCNGYGLHGVTILNIGVSPQPINFSCLVYQLKQLYCHYNATRNYVKETVKIERAHHNGSLQLVPAAQIKPKLFLFNINETFEPFDRIEFRVMVNNSLGPALHDNYTFKTNEIVVLPNNFTINVTTLTSKKASVTWELPLNYNQYEFIHVQHLNEIRTEFDQVKMSNSTSHVIFESKVKLPYAYTNYTLQLYTCVKNGIICSTQRAHGEVQFKSKARKPDAPPQLLPDAFEHKNNGKNVAIYWMPVATHFRNADNYTVKLQKQLTNGTFVDSKNVRLSETGATIHNLDPHNEYEIRLIAENSVGKSKTFSSITIPRKSNLLQPPENMKGVKNDSLYHLSWSSSTPVDNYTVFACESLDEQSNLCQNLFYYKTINGSQFSYIFNNTSNTQNVFAISSNLNSQSSGMKWFTCLSSTKIGMAKIDHISDFVVNGTSIKVDWSLPCKTSPFLQSINIKYCELDTNDVCVSLSRSVQLPSQVFIDELRPYTNYTLVLAMFDGNETGPETIISFKTHVGVPDPPFDISYSKVTNTSLQIFWTPPNNWNGQPHCYKVSYANKSGSYFYQTRLGSSTILDNLSSSTEYIIKVAACHSKCSPFSHEIIVNTGIGVPGLITNFESDQNGRINRWSPPYITNGVFQLYEIKFDILTNGIIKTITSSTSSTTCTLEKYFCGYNVSIRTINLNDTINMYAFTKPKHPNCREEFQIDYTVLCSSYECVPSNWAMVATAKCEESNIGKIMRTTLYVFVAVFVLGILYILIRVGYKRYKEIVELDVSIPEGLDSIFESCQRLYENSTNSTDHLSDDNDSQTITCVELQIEIELCELLEPNRNYEPH